VLPRAYVPDLDSARGRVVLSEDESAHLTRVLRLRVGAHLLVFDGRGTQYLGTLETITKNSATVALAEPSPAAREPRVTLTLAQAVLKGDKMDIAVRDATMMGVSAIVPIVTDRTVVALSAVEQSRVVERWQRVAVASAKQCGRAVVPAIAAPFRVETMLATRQERFLLQLVEPSAAARDTVVSDRLPDEPPATVLVAIGPEGGWSADEIIQAREAGARLWTLGERTLRAESAPLAALSVLTYVWRL
jgi:16S rRNA (uracil1498-N3)-methyltransferase